MHDFVRTGGSVNSVWKQFPLQVEWGIKWNLDRIIFITLEWMILEFIAYKEGKKKSIGISLNCWLNLKDI